jgi:hypothetical protein
MHRWGRQEWLYHRLPRMFTLRLPSAAIFIGCDLQIYKFLSHVNGLYRLFRVRGRAD